MNTGATSIPYGMQLFAFVASGLLTVLSIILIIRKLLKISSLKIKLTREVFFRLTDAFAEAIFANGVIVSENGGVLIDDISFKLNKINDSTKCFNLRCAFIGEKVRGLSPISDLNWYSTSPISYVPEAYPQRISFLLVQQDYEEKLRKVYFEFRNSIIEALKFFRNTDPNLDENIKHKNVYDFYDKIQAIIKDHSSRIMEIVQIEPGDYELEAKVFWRIKKINKKIEKSAISKITFKVDKNIKEILREDLSLMLQTISSNLILGQNQQVKNPEYCPIEVREI